MRVIYRHTKWFFITMRWLSKQRHSKTHVLQGPAGIDPWVMNLYYSHWLPEPQNPASCSVPTPLLILAGSRSPTPLPGPFQGREALAEGCRAGWQGSHKRQACDNSRRGNSQRPALTATEGLSETAGRGPGDQARWKRRLQSVQGRGQPWSCTGEETDMRKQGRFGEQNSKAKCFRCYPILYKRWYRENLR